MKKSNVQPLAKGIGFSDCIYSFFNWAGFYSLDKLFYHSNCTNEAERHGKLISFRYVFKTGLHIYTLPPPSSAKAIVGDDLVQ